MTERTEARMVELMTEMHTTQKFMATNLKDLNDKHVTTINELKEIKVGINGLSHKTLWLLTMTIAALAALAGAEKIIALV